MDRNKLLPNKIHKNIKQRLSKIVLKFILSRNIKGPVLSVGTYHKTDLYYEHRTMEIHAYISHFIRGSMGSHHLV